MEITNFSMQIETWSKNPYFAFWIRKNKIIKVASSYEDEEEGYATHNVYVAENPKWFGITDSEIAQICKDFDIEWRDLVYDEDFICEGLISTRVVKLALKHGALRVRNCEKEVYITVDQHYTKEVANLFLDYPECFGPEPLSIYVDVVQADKLEHLLFTTKKDIITYFVKNENLKKSKTYNLLSESLNSITFGRKYYSDEDWFVVDSYDKQKDLYTITQEIKGIQETFTVTEDNLAAFFKEYKIKESFSRRLLTEADKTRFLAPVWEVFTAQPEAAMQFCNGRNPEDLPSLETITKWVNSGAADNYKIDWNKLKDFRNRIDKSEGYKLLKAYFDYTDVKANRNYKKDPKKLFQKESLFQIIYENDNWLFVMPKSYEACKFIDSYRCGGSGAKWCIGWEKSDEHWVRYINEGSYFCLAYNKNLWGDEGDQKWMLEFKKDEYDEDFTGIEAWPQNDEPAQTLNTSKTCKHFGLQNVWELDHLLKPVWDATIEETKVNCINYNKLIKNKARVNLVPEEDIELYLEDSLEFSYLKLLKYLGYAKSSVGKNNRLIWDITKNSMQQRGATEPSEADSLELIRKMAFTNCDRQEAKYSELDSRLLPLVIKNGSLVILNFYTDLTLLKYHNDIPTFENVQSLKIKNLYLTSWGITSKGSNGAARDTLLESVRNTFAAKCPNVTIDNIYINPYEYLADKSERFRKTEEGYYYLTTLNPRNPVALDDRFTTQNEYPGIGLDLRELREEVLDKIQNNETVKLSELVDLSDCSEDDMLSLQIFNCEDANFKIDLDTNLYVDIDCRMCKEPPIFIKHGEHGETIEQKAF